MKCMYCGVPIEKGEARCGQCGASIARKIGTDTFNGKFDINEERYPNYEGYINGQSYESKEDGSKKGTITASISENYSDVNETNSEFNIEKEDLATENDTSYKNTIELNLTHYGSSCVETIVWMSVVLLIASMLFFILPHMNNLTDVAIDNFTSALNESE